MKNFKQLFSIGSLALATAFIFTACNNAEEKKDGDKKDDKTEVKDAPKADENGKASATLTGTQPDTTLSGTADFSAAGGKVKLSLMLNIPKMANKTVAVHLHEMGDCGDMGKMAHGHWNPTNKQHGKWGSASFHSGDIGNVTLDATGKGTMELETDLWTIGGDEKTNILNKSVIVHNGMDDFTTQPTGNAGTRIGCGVIMKK